MNSCAGSTASVATALLGLIASCLAQPAKPPVTDAVPGIPRGRELALKYCANGHLFPEPDLLTKSAWVHHIQPEMAKWLGIERFDYEGNPDGRLLEEAKLFPPSPILPEEDWFAIWDYYRAQRQASRCRNLQRRRSIPV